MKYVSELTELKDKVFDKVEDLEKAEADVKAANTQKALEATKKKAELVKINRTANEYLKLVAENNKKREELRKAEQEAYKAYRKEIDDFAEKHQGYHLTYKIDGDNVEFQIEEVKQKTIEDFYKELQESKNIFTNFFNNFWF